MAALLAVAALSARMLAELARQDGYDVVALDVFGDADTRRAASAWWPIGSSQGLQIDPERASDALSSLARESGGEILGWVPGGGFEGQMALLEAAAPWLPLMGTPPAGVRRVRDPRQFFSALAALGLPHPPVQYEAPEPAAGWLLKDAQACGGWHIRHADRLSSPGSAKGAWYFQRAMPGVPMSVTFLANGQTAQVMGFNELQVQAGGEPSDLRPFGFAGCVGPVPLPPAMAGDLGEAVRLLTAEFGLRGWCSLDFLRDGQQIHLLEVNPRPPASMALYARPGAMDAQLRACLQGELPHPSRFVSPQVSGSLIVHTPGDMTLSPAQALCIATWPGTHDLPHPGTVLAAGDPLCSLSARGGSPADVNTTLISARDALLTHLETCHD